MLEIKSRTTNVEEYLQKLGVKFQVKHRRIDDLLRTNGGEVSVWLCGTDRPRQLYSCRLPSTVALWPTRKEVLRPASSKSTTAARDVMDPLQQGPR